MLSQKSWDVDVLVVCDSRTDYDSKTLTAFVTAKFADELNCMKVPYSSDPLKIGEMKLPAIFEDLCDPDLHKYPFRLRLESALNISGNAPLFFIVEPNMLDEGQMLRLNTMIKNEGPENKKNYHNISAPPRLHWVLCKKQPDGSCSFEEISLVPKRDTRFEQMPTLPPAPDLISDCAGGYTLEGEHV